jgi:hypothetical protein
VAAEVEGDVRVLVQVDGETRAAVEVTGEVWVRRLGGSEVDVVLLPHAQPE